MRWYNLLINRLHLPLFVIMGTPLISYWLGLKFDIFAVPLPIRKVLFARLDCDLSFIKTHFTFDPMLYATAYFAGFAALLVSIPFALVLLFAPWNSFQGTKIHDSPIPPRAPLMIWLIPMFTILIFFGLSIMREGSAVAPNCSWFEEVTSAMEARREIFMALGRMGLLQACLYLTLWMEIMMVRKIRSVSTMT